MGHTYLGFDFGTRRIGVAVGQSVTKSAKPLTMVSAKDGQPNWPDIHRLIQTWRPQALVVGVPLNMDGSEQPVTVLARVFIDQLKQKTQLPVYEVDERLSTVAAREVAFERGGYRALKKTQMDSVAAQVILQDWLSHLDAAG